LSPWTTIHDWTNTLAFLFKLAPVAKGGAFQNNDIQHNILHNENQLNDIQHTILCNGNQHDIQPIGIEYNFVQHNGFF
jgi:hypothetical protein